MASKLQVTPTKLQVTPTKLQVTPIKLQVTLTKLQVQSQPRSQGLRGETMTKTLVKFILSFQNFGKKIACAVRHNRIAITELYLIMVELSDCNTVEYG